jgi:alkaline phosphatase D
VLEDAGSALAPIDPMGRPLGIAYLDLMKGGLFSSIGSRALVAAGPFGQFAAKRWEETDGASETAMGAEQESWFLETMRGSAATWKLWANEFCLSPLQIDLSLLDVPPSFKRVFNITVDDWNGLPNRRDLLLGELADIGNVVALTGDIHAFFAATPMVRGAMDRKIVELVGGSISSLAFQPLLQRQVEDDPGLSSVPGATDLAGAIRDLLLQLGPNPHLAFADVTSHGYAVVEASADALLCTFYMHAESEVHVNHYDSASLGSLFNEFRFRVDAGSPELFHEINGTWLRWDPATRSFV